MKKSKLRELLKEREEVLDAKVEKDAPKEKEDAPAPLRKRKKKEEE